MSTGIDRDTYAVLRDRLTAQAGELARRAEALNAARIAEFGSGELTLIRTGSLRTEHASVPRDAVAVGEDLLLLGRHTAAPDGSGPAVADVFTLYDRDLNPLPEDAVPGLLDDPGFRREFAALHRYFRGTRLLRLRRVEGRLLAVFQVGEKPGDLRVLRWSTGPSGAPRFLDAQGERDHVLPASQEVDWVEAGREDHVPGRFPHVAVGGGRLFVSTVGGVLTLKTENDTETAEGVHAEPVEEPLQSLADAEVAHATVGPLLLVRVRPYKEEVRRHLVFNTLTGTVARLDGLEQACLRLPEDAGLVFPGGYCLATGTVKTFDADTSGLAFDQVIRSPNGEDLLYVFQDQAEGRVLLLPYNLIRKEVTTPLAGRGHALLDDGTMLLLRDDSGEPGRVHQAQVWRTPYLSDVRATPTGDGPLGRIGNADLVRGISDCLAISRQATEPTPAGEVYGALLAACVRAGDVHHWLGDPAAGDLRTPLTGLLDTLTQVLDEFETVTTLTRQAAEALAEAAEGAARLSRRIHGEAPATAEEWISRITELRQAQGHVVTLKEMRYADAGAIESLAARIEDDIVSAAGRAVLFLGRDDAFAPQHAEAEELAARAGELATAADAGPVGDRIGEQTLSLRALSEIITGLDIADATVRTSILARIADVLGALNRARAVLTTRRAELLDREGAAEFAAELALLGQTVAGALAAAGTPEACDDQLGRLMVQLENLEARFSESEGLLDELAEKRAEIHEALSARRQSLQDARARKAERLADSAGRVLESVARRSATLKDRDEVHAYFASDPMVVKVRRTAAALRDLGDGTRAEELESRLAATRQEAGRALRDRTDLYSDGGDTIRLGRHRFAVNRRTAELTVVPSGDTLVLALTGTDYRVPVTDPALSDTRRFWNRPLPSESPEVYRSEHLAARLLAEHGADRLAGEDLHALARRAAEDAYDEGYERGVHDHDAALILEALLGVHGTAGLLRHPGRARAAAQLHWAHAATAEDRVQWAGRAASLTRARDLFGAGSVLDGLRRDLSEALGDPGAAAYLVEELAAEPAGFVVSAPVRALLEKFRHAVGPSGYDDSLAALTTPGARRQHVEAWLTAYASASGDDLDADVLAEAVAVELSPGLERYEGPGTATAKVTGLLGGHPRLTDRTLDIRLDEFLTRTAAFAAVDVPAHRAYQQRRRDLVDAERARLRLDEYRPRVMPSFVRNRLVDDVYLPLVGDNLAKQLGAAGDGKRGDSHGLLLLLSPPGYGKTTLVEYVADRLGLLLVKVDGPALGPRTLTLDPAEAPDAAARRELEKVAFALAAGNNVLLYLDDIQHCSPEFLQKFIPLCDTTRTLDGHDLRGKRFAVCMAGNPYTESGHAFRVPDMLANRADVWNLGDVLTGKEEAFAFSFVENALTSNPVLAPLAGRERADVELLVRLAAGDPTARRDRLAHPYAPAELDQVLAVLRHLLTARETVLAVNAEYIASAARSDEARTEPPFRLQGSYRTMNKIAARVSPAMNDAELAALVDDHYTAEAQTLTTDAEANLLKLAGLRGTLTPAQAARWAEITAVHARTRALGGTSDDPLSRAVAALGLLADRITAVETAITRATDPRHLLARPAGRHAASAAGTAASAEHGETARPGVRRHQSG
ncbi:DNA repair ATPase [Streptomyces sp. NPDC014773]|uniref:DNA repair ATPase n=1 Tax=Streptomyces sp. NPDC014773 TaxID=3364908 RepID=UPI0036FBE04E